MASIKNAYFYFLFNQQRTRNRSLKIERVLSEIFIYVDGLFGADIVTLLGWFASFLPFILNVLHRVHVFGELLPLVLK